MSARANASRVGAEARSKMLEAGSIEVQVASMEMSMDDARKRGPIRSFRDIEAYQRARAVQPAIYKLAASLPDFEKFDLADQMRRACKSVATNIAEGYAKRDSVAEFKRFLRISMGSANEMEVHLETASDLGYSTRDECAKLIAEYQIIGKQLHRLIESWQKFSSSASSVQHPASAPTGKKSL